MKILTLIILVLPSMAYAATPTKWVGGNISFAIATVGGTPAFTVAEKNALIASPGGTVVNLTANFYEFAVSTTIATFSNNSDFIDLLTSKPYIVEKVLDLEADLLSCQDLAARYPSVAGVTAKINKLKAQIDLLVGLHQSLP